MINVVVIGYGRAGEAHARCWDHIPEARIAAVVDPTPARRLAARARHPTATVAADLDGLPGNIHLALICTPPASHEHHIEQALVRGIHVFCEKPVFLNPANGERLVELARSHGKTIHPGHNYLHSPLLQRLRKLGTPEHIGALQRVEMLIQRTSPATGTPDWNPNWRTDPNISGGGILVDHGPHCIYLTEWLTGQRIQRADCKMKYALPGVEDHVELELTLEGHAAAHILLTWRGSHRTNSYQLIGTAGTATLTGDTVEVDGRLGRQTWRNSETPGTLHAHDDWLPAQAAAILGHIAAGTENSAVAQSALVVANVIAAARGRPSLSAR